MTDAKRRQAATHTVRREQNDDGTVTYTLTVPASDDQALRDAAIDAGLLAEEWIYRAVAQALGRGDQLAPRPPGADGRTH